MWGRSSCAVKPLSLPLLEAARLLVSIPRFVSVPGSIRIFRMCISYKQIPPLSCTPPHTPPCLHRTASKGRYLTSSRFDRMSPSFTAPDRY